MSFSGSILTLSLLSISAVTTLASVQTSYNSKNQICCNGTVHDKGALGRVGCCSAEAYDYVNFRCCGCGDQPFGFDSYSLHNIKSCLQGRSMLYDHRKQACCNSEVVDKPDPEIDYGCCKGQLFDKTVQRCCGEQLLENISNEQCCGDRTYNHESQICCEEYGDDLDNYHLVVDFRIVPRSGNTTACCGLETYDFRTHVCCDDVVVLKKEGMDEKRTSSCCDGEAYDKNKQFCCRRTGKVDDTYVIFESILYDMEDAHQCCGLLNYNFHDEICCGNYTISKPEGAPWETRMSCCDGQPVINSSTQTCINGKIFDRKDPNFGVCGGELYDRRVRQCCGQQTYDVRTHVCCARRVYERAPNLKCCYYSST